MRKLENSEKLVEIVEFHGEKIPFVNQRKFHRSDAADVRRITLCIQRGDKFFTIDGEEFEPEIQHLVWVWPAVNVVFYDIAGDRFFRYAKTDDKKMVLKQIERDMVEPHLNVVGTNYTSPKGMQ